MIRNRWIRGAVSLAIGFIFMTAVLRIAEESGDSLSAGQRLGELSMVDYCRRQYGPRSTAVRLQPGAYGWRCWSQRNQLFDPSDIDPDAACETMFGAPAYAQSDDPSKPFSWVCFSGSR